MSPEYLALAITINTIITSIAIGNILLNRESQPPKWASRPTDFAYKQLRRIIDRVKEKNQ